MNIKSLAIKTGGIVAFKGELHYVKDFQLVHGSGAVLDLVPLGTTSVKAHIEEVDDAGTITQQPIKPDEG